jgi:hypothetical protein
MTFATRETLPGTEIMFDCDGRWINGFVIGPSANNSACLDVDDGKGQKWKVPCSFTRLHTLVPVLRSIPVGERPHTWVVDQVRELTQQLHSTLYTYECSGDHNHGQGRIAPGAPCAGGDCHVTRIRKALELLGEI